METFLGIRFLSTEYSTGKTHKGRIDSLGLDENGCPVIIEYKRNTNENVINQGLFYLDWLLDHKGEFQLLVMNKFGDETARDIEWKGTRLICIASDFTKYDEHAIAQINKSIELIRYKLFPPDILLLELVNAVSVNLEDNIATEIIEADPKAKRIDKTHIEIIESAPPKLKALLDDTRNYINSLDDDVQEKEVKYSPPDLRVWRELPVSMGTASNKTEILPGCLTFPPQAVSLIPNDNIRKPSFFILVAAFMSLS